MIFRNLRYFFSQGIRGLVSNSLMTLASVGIVIASLVLFGTFVLLGMNLNYIGEQIKEQCEINVYLPRDMSRDDVRKIGSELAKIKYVKEAQLYTKEERFNNFKDSSYEEQADVIDMLEQDNPLRDSYILVLEDVSRANKHMADTGFGGCVGIHYIQHDKARNVLAAQGNKYNEVCRRDKLVYTLAVHHRGNVPRYYRRADCVGNRPSRLRIDLQGYAGLYGKYTFSGALRGFRSGGFGLSHHGRRNGHDRQRHVNQKAPARLGF